MDSLRSISVVSVAQLVVAGAMTPALADVNESDEHRRHHGRGCVQTVSHSRDDYPVIFHWLTTPEIPNVAAPTA